ncbi:MAG: bifunctional 5,10-methylenetetrahydrofolate dehydrogenase/5,10-methenyltetrahydrofolate cyclohydrolase, partial [Candidatus Ornithospirochaeta sp.]
YVKTKTEKASLLGYVSFQYFLNGDSREEEVISLIESLNDDDRVDGILLQLPLPSHLNEKRIIEHISVDKDVDGFTALNMGKMMKGEDCFIPCTPKGILTILSHFGISTVGKRVTVIGRSDIVGKPLALLLMGKGYDATVSVANSKTKDLRALTLSSDIVISAVGKPMMLDSSYFSDGTVIIDVGINRISDPTRKRGWRTVGDVDRDSLIDRDVLLTPVPGGVGLMTVASLMENTFISRERRG